jgi:hypothetical protein
VRKKEKEKREKKKVERQKAKAERPDDTFRLGEREKANRKGRGERKEKGKAEPGLYSALPNPHTAYLQPVDQFSRLPSGSNCGSDCSLVSRPFEPVLTTGAVSSGMTIARMM